MSWRLRHSLAAFQHRNFRLFVVGQFISLIGFWMQGVAQSWLVYRLTGSAAYLGAVAFAQQIPVLLFGFAAGGLVDRTNRRRIVILTQMAALVQAAIMAALTYFGHITITQIFILATLLGIIGAIDMPARQAFLIQMVGKEDLMNAIAINSSMFNAARIIGPAIAGLTLSIYGEAFCFLMNAVSYVAVLISLWMMKIRVHEVSRKQSIIRDLKEGLQYIRETRPIRVMLELVGALGTTGFSFVVLMPIFADRIFARGAPGLAWLMTATGAGALIGALFLAGRKGLKGISKIIAISSFGFSISLMIFSASSYFWLSLLTLVSVGIFMMTSVASINTAIQSLIPDHLRGRVMSLFTTMLIGTAPIGSLIAGTAAKYFGVRITVFGASLICIGAATWFYRTLPAIVPEARRLYELQNPQLANEPVPPLAGVMAAAKK
jgi:MFS family permease